MEQGKAHEIDLNVIYPEKKYIFGDFTERLWAYLTIQQLMENRFDDHHIDQLCLCQQ